MTVTINLIVNKAHFLLYLHFRRHENLIANDYRHTPTMYPLSPGAGFRSPYPSTLPISTSSLPSDFYRFSPTGLIPPHPGLSPHGPLPSHPAIVTPGPKQELPDLNHRYPRYVSINGQLHFIYGWIVLYFPIQLQFRLTASWVERFACSPFTPWVRFPAEAVNF